MTFVVIWRYINKLNRKDAYQNCLGLLDNQSQLVD